MIPLQPSTFGAGLGGAAGGGYQSSATSDGGDDTISQRSKANQTVSTSSGAGARGPVFNFGGQLDASAVNPIGLGGGSTWLIVGGLAVAGVVAWLLFRRKS